MSSKVRVVSRVPVFEVDGESTETLKDKPELKVSSHPLKSGMAILEGPDGSKFTVAADDLKVALANATREEA